MPFHFTNYVLGGKDSLFRDYALPIGNTFGFFCFPRVQNALLRNVYPTFCLPRVLLSTPMGDIIPLLASKRPFGIRAKTCTALLRSISAYSRSRRVSGYLFE